MIALSSDEARGGWVRDSESLSEGFWVIILDWNTLKLRRTIYVIKDLVQKCSKDSGAFQAWEMNGTPSLIYRECVWMVLREVDGGLLRKWTRVEACFGWLMRDNGGCCMSLFAPQTTFCWSLASIRNRHGKRSGLLCKMLFAIFGKVRICTRGRFLQCGNFLLQSWLPTTPKYHMYHVWGPLESDWYGLYTWCKVFQILTDLF